MLFNSVDFAIFLPLVFLLYWLVFNRTVRGGNAFLLVASYLFYGWWDWRFLGLIFFSSVVDFTVARRLAGAQVKRKVWLAISLVTNLGLLGFFKYFNFFAENFASAFTLLGRDLELTSLSIILPVGISFYTFQTLSYTIDVYRKKLEPTADLLEFLAYVSFFPQLVAGPIERAVNLLPQFRRPRVFDYGRAVDGMRQILAGLIKKLVIADNCAVIVNDIFANYEQYPASALVIGAVLFAFQIYGDFAGYSDIAIGTARLLGFDLMRNFANPYFSRDVAEFWRRWHISLTTWFRDYLYIPLGGSRGGRIRVVRNTFIIFLVSGFWHGPAWTFIFWGGLNAVFFLPLLLGNNNRRYLGTVAEDRNWPTPGEVLRMVATFLLITVTWVFFRADSLGHAFDYLASICSASLFELPHWTHMSFREVAVIFVLPVFLLWEWHGRLWQHPLEKLWLTWPQPLRWLAYAGLVLVLFLFTGEEQTFIYFQF